MKRRGVCSKEWQEVYAFDERLTAVYEFAKSRAPQLPYHNMQHMVDVASMAKTYATMEGLTCQQSFILQTAALLHDIVYVRGRNDNEEKSAEIAAEILPKLGYSQDEARDVSRLILATKLPTNPQDIMEMIICDSDLDNLGRYDFLEKSKLIRQELVVEKDAWYKSLPQFLSTIKYYTISARRLRQPGLQKNMKKLRNLK